MPRTRFLYEADGDRTHNLRIDSPLLENANPIIEQELTASSEIDLAEFLAQIVRQHPELAGLIERWPNVAPELRAAILRMVAKGDTGQ